MTLKPGSLFFSKKAIKRLKAEGPNKASGFVEYGSHKGKEFFGILLGVADIKNPPDFDVIVEAVLHNCGWIEQELVEKFFGEDKMEAFFKFVEKEIENDRNGKTNSNQKTV